MKMRQWCKRILCVCLMIVFIAQLCPPMQAEAAVKKMIMYVDEDATYYTGDPDQMVKDYVRSVKSSNSKVVKPAKQEYGYIGLWARKPGKALITVQTKSGTKKYQIMVKKLDVKVSFSASKDKKYYYLKFQNDTDIYFHNVSYQCTLAEKSPEGEICYTTSEYAFGVNDLLAHRSLIIPRQYIGTHYEEGTHAKVQYTLVPEECVVELVGVERKFGYQYKEMSSKLKVGKITDKLKKGRRYITFDVTNPTSHLVDGRVYCMIYDKKDRLIGVWDEYYSIQANSKKSCEMSFSKSTYPGFNHYKLVPRLCWQSNNQG